MTFASENSPVGSTANADKPKAPAVKQAVVMIHGIGEQKPMDTIRNFVRAVWTTDTELVPELKPHPLDKEGEDPKPQQIWSRPDRRTGSLELRRLTTRKSKESDSFPGGVRTDFYEFYWADLTVGSTWRQVQDWIKGLLIRRPIKRVPSKVRLAWILLWFLSLLVFLLALATALPKDATIFSIKVSSIIVPLQWLDRLETWQLAGLTALLGYLTHSFVVPYAGRVVRYTRAEPDNIAVRKNVRERGLELLRDLHTAEYNRIVLVGHSLGSIVAYDLVTYFWAERTKFRTIRKADTVEFPALKDLARAADRLMKVYDAANGSAEDLRTAQQNFWNAQTKLGHLLRCRPKPKRNDANNPVPPEEDPRWIITDLVTLGSPLTHAEFLLAKSAEDLEKRKAEREYPTSPPYREFQDPDVGVEAQRAGLIESAQERRLFCYPVVGSAGSWRLDDGAPFGLVRWTNIYDPAWLVIFGDIISGSVAPAFGPGVRDINLKDRNGRWSRRFTHTLYWTNGAEGEVLPRIQALREALDLGGQRRIL